jgi:plastocyanin
MHGGRIVVALALAGAVAAPSAAQARTKTVQVGPFGAKQAVFQAAFGDGNAYFRRKITIHKGDKVKWVMNGFHSVTFPGSGGAPDLLAPDPAHPVTGVNDADGNAFWFNGLPSIAINPLAVLKQGGAKLVPGQLANSGLPLAPGAPPPYTLKFKNVGTFKYICVLHPGMAGKVKVVKKGRHIPSARRDRRAARREQNRILAQVQTLATGAGLALSKTMQAGNDRTNGATVYKFFPADPTFNVGDTVTLQMSPKSTEAHTFTLGPTNEKNLYLDDLANVFLGPTGLDPRGGFPSDPPPALVQYDGKNHGNGFFNSGVLDSDAATTTIPSSSAITFTKPGNYDLICLIHPFMRTKVSIKP